MLNELQLFRPEVARVCPIAGNAIQEAFTTFQRGAIWEAFRWLGEASGALEVYIAVARQEYTALGDTVGDTALEARLSMHQNLKTWLMTIFSSAQAVANLEWEKRKLR
jgi:hypothetical protein